mmetsp:Transcript_760/g.2090  ORF Transcript_760/g.2090 Transcript_760/m.2090 type:complete len:144 (-) Transcript_760:503-934(-)
MGVGVSRTGPHVSLAVVFVVEGGAGTKAMVMHFLDLLATCSTSTSTWALQERLAVTYPSIYMAVLALDPADLVHFRPLHDAGRLLMLMAHGRRADEARTLGPTPSSSSSSTCSSRCRRTSRSPTTTSASRSGCSSASAPQCCR